MGLTTKQVAQVGFAFALLLIGPRALPLDAENQGYLDRMDVPLATHNAALVLGLGSSGVAGTGIEITELSANLVLKTIPAVLVVPEDKVVYPELGSGGDYRCSVDYTTPQTSASTSELLGLGVIKALPTYWGDFGTPRVEHRNSSVLLTLGGLPGLQKTGDGFRGSFPEGDHTIRWLAETQYSPFWDGAFPAFMVGFGVLSEAKFGKVFFKPLSKQGAKKAAKNQSELADLAKDIGLAAGILSAEIASDELNLIGDEQPSAQHVRTQLFRVWDVHPPEFRDPNTSATIESQTVSIEASDFGGARFNRIRDELISKFRPYDDCGRSISLQVTNAPSLIPSGDTGVELEWVIQDGGRYNVDRPLFDLAPNQEFLDGEPGDASPARFLRTLLRQRVIVRDRQPPLLFRPGSFVRETTANIVLNDDPATIRNELGVATAIDLADPVPEIFTTAPAVLEAPEVGEPGRRYLIHYDAVDDAGNFTVANSANPEQYTQIVTLKQPGANTAPRAVEPATASTVSDMPVRIRLTGVDDDDIGGLFDPLVFNIVEPPAQGEFVAPLYPTFIEDYRSKPTRTPTADDPPIADCPATPEELTSGAFLEQQLGLMDVGRHDNYVTDCYCAANTEPPRDFVYRPNYVHITDEGLRYVSDNPYVCNNQPGDPGVRNRARLGTWRDGAPVNEHLQNFASGSNSRTFDVDAQGFVWQLILGAGQGGSASADVERYQPDLAITGREDNLTLQSGSNPFGSLSPSNVVSSFADLERGVLYVADKSTVAVFALDGPDDRLAIADLRSQTEFNGLSIDAACNTLPGLENSAKQGFTMQTDSQGNLYVADSCAHQVHKFSPTSLALDGSVSVGDYQGWLGKCTSNRQDSATGVQFNNCVVEEATSNGFACTDETCGVDPFARNGGAPGQFNVITHLNLDPNDTLYIADFGNQRIQRFGADGVFAGEARSTGAGISRDSSFVLGNMGAPRHVSVNSSSFHVLESRPAVGDFFLHIFSTLPFTDITPDGATVEYVSDPSFTGTDHFTFLVDDGLAESAEATVTIIVNETQRPPSNLRAQCYTDAALQNENACTLLEDTELFIRLTSSDADGFAGFGGRDSHSFSITSDPSLGELNVVPGSTTANGEVFRYEPKANANGVDKFSFQANDGIDDAETAGSVALTISPVADDVVLTFPDDLRVARGFEETIVIEFSDPDQDPNSLLQAQVFDWGDGVVATGVGGWTNIGVFDDDGNPVDPQRDTLTGEGLLIGAHVFDTSTAGYRITLQDGATQVVATSDPVVVSEVTRVSVARLDGSDLQPDTDTLVQIRLTNDQPQTWAGLVARSVSVDIEVPNGLELVSFSSAACTLVNQTQETLRCNGGDLNVGESITFDVTVRVDLATARNSQLYGFRTSQSDAGPRLATTTESVILLEVADQDGDGVIDVDDAFPADDRYSEDSDGDGAADAWELEHGFDINNSADGTLDLDQDGFSNRLEFELGGSPRLADPYLASDKLTSDQSTVAQDRFGIALGSADVDGDGLADVVMGAPTYAPNGAAFVHFGVNAVESQLLTKIEPAAAVFEFGRSAAVGDLDGNGFADLAIGGANSISIYLVTASGIPAEPSHVLIGGVFDNVGEAVLIADIDDDGALDLIYSSPAHTNGVVSQGAITVYRASSSWWLDSTPTPSKVFLGPSTENFRLGRSLAVADIDGDMAADLLAGSVFGNGQVYGFLGSSRDWSTPVRSDPDLIFSGEQSGDRFGWSISADGDLDADGINDLAVGAYRHGTTGAVYIYASGDAYFSQPQPTFSDKVAVGSLNDQFGVRVSMLAPSGAKIGADLLVGANRFEQGSTLDEGTFYLYSGGALPLGSPQQQLSDSGHDMLGYNLIGTADINGDGNNDFVVGAPDISVTGHTGDGGFVQLFYGGSALAQSDADEDNVADSLDNCLDEANLNQADLDSDGRGDVCDVDIDGDGFNNDLDNCPLTASATQVDTDSDGDGNACDDDDDGDGTEDMQDAFPLDANYQLDSDGDGLPDRYEAENGLNLNDSADATADLDGDGRNNLAEFQQGSDVGADDVAPVLTIPSDRVAQAIGILTPVAIGTATATDAKDGSLTPTADNPGPYFSGRHAVTWSATDAAGNVATAVQRVDVNPMLNFVGKSQQIPEGDANTVQLELSGDAVQYPVIVGLEIGGSASSGEDFQPIITTIEVDSNNVVSLPVQTLGDTSSEGTEEIVFTINSVTNAVAGSNNRFVMQIVEGNVLARVRIAPSQNGATRRTLFADQGPVVLSAAIVDANTTDTHLLDWSATDSALLASEGPGSTTFTFDPAGLDAGLYRAQLTVIDSSEPTQSITTELWMKVIASRPLLSSSTDSDGDGISDNVEGFADADLDGVPAYQDSNDRADRMLMRTADQAYMQTEPGARLRLGTTAQAAGDQANIGLAEVSAFGSNGASALAATDDSFIYLTGVSDFEIWNLSQPGDTALVVLPLDGTIPSDASYRKYITDLGWQDFDTSGGDQIASAPGTASSCPAPGHSLYQPGLGAGHRCVQLSLTDGGLNDADGQANGTIKDPGGVAMPNVPATLVLSGTAVPDKSVASGQTEVAMLRFTLTSNTGSTRMDTIRLQASGSGDDSMGIRNVRLWADLDNNGEMSSGDAQIGVGTYSADNGRLDLAPTIEFDIPAGDSHYLVTYDF